MEYHAQLPASVDSIIERFGRWTAGYGPWRRNALAKLKGDMTNVRQRWLHVNPVQLAEKCRNVGLTEDETAEIVDWVRRVQRGRRLVARRSYRHFRFAAPPEAPPSPT
ncbi:hypothetical protein ACPW96_22295 [Micromonospora sp. DT81.3]|uniref:hypothetical protein n=1 Tax=Micromonospora sp. DT81.3 TaxID=3416523 RepID=UPI003CEC800C